MIYTNAVMRKASKTDTYVLIAKAAGLKVRGVAPCYLVAKVMFCAFQAVMPMKRSFFRKEIRKMSKTSRGESRGNARPCASGSGSSICTYVDAVR